MIESSYLSQMHTFGSFICCSIVSFRRPEKWDGDLSERGEVGVCLRAVAMRRMAIAPVLAGDDHENLRLARALPL